MTFFFNTTWQVRDKRGRRKYVNQHERLRFMEAADFEPMEFTVLCYVLVFTGCRITEALNLTPDLVDAENDELTFHTLKRRRSVFRVVPVPPEIPGMFEKLTPGADGRYFSFHRVTAWRHVKAVMERAEIDGPMATCKGLRHGFGIHAAAKNVPQGLVQRWMGHSSPATTSIYIDAVGNEERAFASRMWTASSAV